MQESKTTTKTALITGAARRIGAEIARTLHAAGLNVVIHYFQSEAEALALCANLNQIRADSAVCVKANLDEPRAGKALVDAALQAFGRLDVLVNNASRFFASPPEKATPEAFDVLMNTNAKAPYFITLAAAKALGEVEGAVVNIIDIHGKRPLKDYALYSASKAALWMLTKALAKELAPFVRVNGVAPGAIVWPEGENMISKPNQDAIIHETLLKRHGCEEDIAEAVRYLALQAGYTTGHVLLVDGGRLTGAGG